MSTRTISGMTADTNPANTAEIELQLTAGGSTRKCTLQNAAKNIVAGSDRGCVKIAAAVADLAGGITNPPTQAEVTAIYNKVNDLLAKLRTSGVLTP